MTSSFSLMDALAGEEGRFLGAALGMTPDLGWLAEYRAFLVARGDPRGEVLRVQEALLGALAPGQAPALLARLEALVAGVDPTWWRCVDRLGRLRTCGQASGRPPALRFAFECGNRWEALASTDDPRVRHCGDCSRSVHWCGTRGEAEAHARAGDCITVPAHVAGAAGAESTRHMTGRPDPIECWGRAIFGDAGTEDR